MVGMLALIKMARRKLKLAMLKGALSIVKGSGANTASAPQLVERARRRERSPCPYQQHTRVLSVRPKTVKLKANLVILRTAALNSLGQTKRIPHCASIR